MTTLYFTGFETGDTSEVTTPGTGNTSQSTTVRSGAYAFQKVSTAGAIWITGLNTPTVAGRFYFRKPGTNGIVGSRAICRLVNVTDGNGLNVDIMAGDVLGLSSQNTIGLSPIAGTTVIQNDVWYLVEVVYDVAINGVCKLWVDGQIQVDTTHTIAVNNVDRIQTSLLTTDTDWYFDDLLFADGTTNLGAGRSIVRQGLAGTPTYNAWTKVGAATAALCWSDTPFSTATNCTSTVVNDAQTMLVAKFSTPSAGHGNETIGPIDTINACKQMMIGKTAVAGNCDMRRRIAAADTDVARALTTSDAYYQGAFFTTTLANLDAAEIGVKSDLATLTTIEDMWLSVDYTDNLMGQAVM